MKKEVEMSNELIVSPEVIKAHIYELRGRRIMVDSDLAQLYGVETKNLKRAVRMNIERFPEDFMFELTKEEYDFLRCNFFTLKNGRGSTVNIFRMHSRKRALLNFKRKQIIKN